MQQQRQRKVFNFVSNRKYKSERRAKNNSWIYQRWNQVSGRVSIPCQLIKLAGVLSGKQSNLKSKLMCQEQLNNKRRYEMHQTDLDPVECCYGKVDRYLRSLSLPLNLKTCNFQIITLKICQGYIDLYIRSVV
jgi:hypothetical protein